jgi:hypothetical protein
MRQDGGNAGSNRVTLDYGGLPDTNAFHIGDRIDRSCTKHSRHDPEVSSAADLLSIAGMGNAENQGRRTKSCPDGRAVLNR